MKKIVYLIALALLQPISLQAATIIIPGDEETIQAGIDAAEDGDTLLVLPGVYPENIDFDGKAIAVIGIGTPELTVIDGGGEGPCVLFENGEDQLSLLFGFTLQNGVSDDDGFGGGIDIHASAPSIIFNIITGNSAEEGGGGIAIREPPRGDIIPPIIYRNIIIGNQCAGPGGGIYASLAGAIVLNNTILDNSSDAEGAALYNNQTPLGVMMINNIVVGNTSARGGAIYANGMFAAVTARYNDVWENEGGDYGRVRAGEGSISEDPLLVAPVEGIYFLQEDSPCIDAGDPNTPLDLDGSDPDMGAMPSIALPEYELLAVEPDSIDFGEIEVGQDSTITLTLTNPNEAEMMGILTVPLVSQYVVNDTVVNVESEGDIDVTVTFAPEEAGHFEETLNVSTLGLVEFSDTLQIYLPVGNTTVHLSGDARPSSVSQHNIPSTAQLLTCYPNPFNATLGININLITQGRIALDVWNMHGKPVINLYNGLITDENNFFNWIPQGLPSGVYFLRLEHPEGSQEIKIQYIK